MRISKDDPNAFCQPMLTITQAKMGFSVAARVRAFRYWQRLEQSLAAFSNSGSRLGVAHEMKGGVQGYGGSVGGLEMAVSASTPVFHGLY